jgi:hypothetical protein
MSWMPRSRAGATLRLAVAFIGHLARRTLFKGHLAEAGAVAELYAADHLLALTAGERERLPQLSRCVNCGLCALAAGRVAGFRPGDLATGYLRDYSLLPRTVLPVAAREALEAASAACPTGVDLPGVATMVVRLSPP